MISYTFCLIFFIISIGDYCLRTDTDDKTNGFFVAVFERIQVAAHTADVINTKKDVRKVGTQKCKKNITTKKDTQKVGARKCKVMKKHKRKSRCIPVTSSRYSNNIC